jgi:hypothetical protein
VGGEGNDKLLLKGDYQIPTTLQATSLSGIELIKFGNGFNYNFTIAAENVGLGEVLTLDASKLGPPNAVGIDATAVTQGQVDFIGGEGNDVFYGGSNTGANGNIDLTRGGNDFITLHANDAVKFGAAFTADDQVTTTFTGFGVVYLDGDYSAGVTFNATTMVGMAGIIVDPSGDQDYRLTLHDAAGAAGRFFILGPLDPLGTGDIIVDASLETDAILNLQGAAGDDQLTGGALGDTFYTRMGRDAVNGGTGDDVFNANDVGGFRANDSFIGGDGMDTLNILATPGFDVTCGPTTIQDIEVFNVSITEGEAQLTLNDISVAAGGSMTVNVHAISGDARGRIDGSAETDGTLVLNGGFLGADTLIAGQFSNTLKGWGDADKLIAGGGTDTFVYTEVADSQGASYDRIVGLDWAADSIDVMVAPTSIAEKLENGIVDLATFESDLKDAIGNHLGANQAMLFQADGGDQAGKKFLVVDQNGNTGYQAVADLVIWLDGASGAVAIEHII